MSFEQIEGVRQELGLGINRFLRLAGIAKATYYRRKRGAKPRICLAQQEITNQVDGCVESHPRYGYRKIWAVLARNGVTASFIKV